MLGVCPGCSQMAGAEHGGRPMGGKPRGLLGGGTSVNCLLLTSCEEIRTERRVRDICGHLTSSTPRGTVQASRGHSVWPELPTISVQLRFVTCNPTGHKIWNHFIKRSF